MERMERSQSCNYSSCVQSKQIMLALDLSIMANNIKLHVVLLLAVISESNEQAMK